MRLKFFKRSPVVKLIKREGGPPDLASLPAAEREAVIWFKWLGLKPAEYLFWGHLAFMPLAWLLIVFWPPYHNVFVVTDWIADILPHRIFGVLTVTQAQLDGVGARLPRAAYVHFIVEQILLAMVYLLWPLINCLRYWRLYPLYDAYLHRVFVNLDEQRASISLPRKVALLLFGLAVLAFTVWLGVSPDLLLLLIEKGNKPGLLSYNATGTAWGGSSLLLVIGTLILNARGLLAMFRGDWSR